MILESCHLMSLLYIDFQELSIMFTDVIGHSNGLCLEHLIIYSSQYQQRLPYDLLSSLSSALLDGTVYEIVTSLKEVQHLEERNLYNQRTQLIHDYKSRSLHTSNSYDTVYTDTTH